MEKFSIIYDNKLWDCRRFMGLSDAISCGVNAGLRMGKCTMQILDENGSEIYRCEI